ncbi:choline dehydrogenase [Labrys okinawensis]|uniref:choline dehydrogenase n=1 Tax=Labrys okinawensis TaxID=346911 RepID=UPI0039BC68C8
MTDTFDYIIVGAGSAGCAMAGRLTEDGARTVKVLEFGGKDGSVFIQMPSALSIPMNSPKYDWRYHAEPEPALGGRSLHTPRGKVLGGSSSINGMVYIRGHAMDFEAWAEAGAHGWNYASVLPYFKRAEGREEGGNEYRGSDGPLKTSYGALKNPLYQAFVDAAVEAGYPATPDVNGYQQEGFGRMDMTVYKGRRWSAANAYLKPAMKHPNLSVETHALASRILFEGRKAVGVEYWQGSQLRRVRARREVILSAGPINDPQLLKLSGIGPAAELQAAGIEVLHDLAGVGENLQDHLEFYFQMASIQPITLYSVVNPLSKAMVGAEWLLRNTGLGATNHFETCGFIRSRAGIAYPDIQYHFLPMAVSYNGASLASEHGFQAHVGPMRSRSRGHVRLRSKDAREAPLIRFNYMSHPDDWTEMRACVRLTREIFQQKAFEPYRGREIQPGPDVTSDEAIDAFIAQHVESAFHPSGTCRMGAPSDPMTVVDPETRVVGIEGLRIADSSIIPLITNGNLNAPSIMIGEKASDHILGKTMLPPSNAPFYQAQDWQTKQR